MGSSRLSLFDVTGIVVGSIVGADIYVASAITAGMLGPASMIVWAVAGVFAAILALNFAYCSWHVPVVGGPFGYVSAGLGRGWGFVAGWSLLVAELMAMPVFAIAFTSYLEYFVRLDVAGEMAIRAAFLAALTAVNVLGVKAAGRVNDVLTVLKLLPLLGLVVAGAVYFASHPGVLREHYVPLAPQGLSQFPAALVLVFWAYQGFELATLPAGEIEDARRTIPRAIVVGMAIVTGFYLLTNFVVYGAVDWRELARTSTPLVAVGAVLLGASGAAVMSAGALVSVAGSDESDMLATARLSMAMAREGMLPRPLANVHSRFRTPQVALLAQGILALILATYSNLKSLISFSVFTLGIAFLLTCVSLHVLQRRRGVRLVGGAFLPWAGIVVSAFLVLATSLWDKVVGTGVILAGVAVHALFAKPRRVPSTGVLRSRERERIEARGRRMLGNALRLAREGYRWLRHRARGVPRG